jgi:hypothetical protein
MVVLKARYESTYIEDSFVILSAAKDLRPLLRQILRCDQNDKLHAVYD